MGADRAERVERGVAADVVRARLMFLDHLDGPAPLRGSEAGRTPFPRGVTQAKGRNRVANPPQWLRLRVGADRVPRYGSRVMWYRCASDPAMPQRSSHPPSRAHRPASRLLGGQNYLYPNVR
jgi:hypothetical protein